MNAILTLEDLLASAAQQFTDPTFATSFRLYNRLARVPRGPAHILAVLAPGGADAQVLLDQHATLSAYRYPMAFFANGLDAAVCARIAGAGDEALALVASAWVLDRLADEDGELASWLPALARGAGGASRALIAGPIGAYRLDNTRIIELSQLRA